MRRLSKGAGFMRSVSVFEEIARWATSLSVVLFINGCACNNGPDPTESSRSQSQAITRAATFEPKAVATKEYGQSCEGWTDCLSGLCMHMDDAKEQRAPTERWFCSKPCKSHRECGHSSFKCVEWYPGQRACIANSAWTSQAIRGTP